ncbi:hypothetical protein EV700_2153 [Fluviicoccus keumensis]|uniref:Porin-like protein n=1 Tax=Fluviicoccus keumensis TaxID=1435465 RepID=A0A4Q7Z5N3_9GAMM|nr:DcaP family trimeric outer membrane transporter [Fluviicoccus keumensis]RZU45334.1 hypothetical protein EV700_2153 [Fluviicoccus keumensis]
MAAFTLRPLSLAIAISTLTVATAGHAAFKMGDTDVGFTGYLKLDAMVTTTSDGQIATGIGRDFYVPSLTPVGGGNESPVFDMHARQSRFALTTDTPLDNGQKVSGRFEFDLMSTTLGDQRITNGYAPEIRHAFITYGNWTMGQTWSTFMDTNALPDSLDFIGGTDGAVFVRQGLVRYTSGSWQFAVENPETTVTQVVGGVAGRVVTDDNGVPDLVARYNHKAGWGAMSVAVLLRELSMESAGVNDQTLGYGVSVSGKANVTPGDELRFTVNVGSGLGRYMSLNTANDAAVSSKGELEAIDSQGLMLAWKHTWSPQWRSSLILAQQNIDNPVAWTGKLQTSATHSVTANLIKQLANKLSVGVEVRHAVRDLESGAQGEMLRVQSSVKYDF